MATINPKYSLIIPIYKNSKFIPELIKIIKRIDNTLESKLETIFVVDGDIENEFSILKKHLKTVNFKSQLINHSKNFGSFAAIKTGLENGRGEYFSFISADLQEPPELILKIFNKLATKKYDIVIGERKERKDKVIDTLFSNSYWWFYKKFVRHDIPNGGVDIFGCNKKVRNILISLNERNSSLVSLLFWIGFKKEFIKYNRLKRKYGKSAWSFNKKIKYMSDSVYSFSDFPIKLLTKIGFLGILVSITITLIVITSKLIGNINVPGYTATLVIVTFFSSLNLFSLGILGQYIWRTYENTKNRPNSIIMDKINYN